MRSLLLGLFAVVFAFACTEVATGPADEQEPTTAELFAEKCYEVQGTTNEEWICYIYDDARSLEQKREEETECDFNIQYVPYESETEEGPPDGETTESGDGYYKVARSNTDGDCFPPR